MKNIVICILVALSLYACVKNNSSHVEENTKPPITSYRDKIVKENQDVIVKRAREIQAQKSTKILKERQQEIREFNKQHPIIK